jgi:hypothetical protein
MNDSPLELALKAFTIAELWQRLGLSGTPRASCRSPFREDRTASFSIYAGGYRWRDHGTGDGGNGVDFVAHALDLSNSEASRKLIEFAGTGRSSRPREKSFLSRKVNSTPAASKYDPLTDAEKASQRKSWPTFELPTAAEIAAIAQQRDLSSEGVAVAAERGLLFCATWHGYRAWVITDSVRVNAQVRRIDGEIWEEKDSKAWTLPGSIGGWPVGIREALFAGERVRIFAHDDHAGYGGAATWTKTLKGANVHVDSFGFTGLRQSNGKPVDDMNDFVRVDSDEWESERSLIESVFNFVPASAKPPPLW